MATIWLTYAWADNAHGDVDFIAQELERKGLTVKLDRWNIGAGQRLWDQIDNFIQSPSESDAWLMFATQASLGSQPCREEYAYALDRALGARSGAFPVMAVFQGQVDPKVLPAGLRTRLCVSLTDTDWAERIAASAEGRAHEASRAVVEPFHLTQHARADGGVDIEVRPRAGSWAPFTAAIPQAEQARVKMSLSRGGAGGNFRRAGVMIGVNWGTSDDGKWFFWESQEEATPTMSFYIHCEQLPTTLCFGVNNSPRSYRVFLQESQNVTVPRKSPEGA